MNKKIIISLFIFTLFCIIRIPISNAYIKCSGISGYAYDATNGEKGIENIKVELVKYKYDDTKENFIEDYVADTIHTAEDGFYAFNKIGYEDGLYKIRFIYGDSTNGMNEILNTATYINERGYKREDIINQDDLLNIMKYNGQDYWTKKVSVESDEETSWEIEDTTGKKHYVYFVADCSGSMSPFLNEVKICISKMAEKFHEQNEENKMGAIRVLEPENCKFCVPLTSNIDELSAENLSAQGLDVGYGIDENLIYGVFLAANDFYENYQKPYYDEGIDFNEADFDVSIVVLTDGWPCLPLDIYKNIDMTAQYYNELINVSDINLYPIAIGNYGGIFNNNVPYWQATDVNMIEDVFKSIYTSISTGEKVKTQNSEACFSDDALRREQINNEFMNSNYEKIKMFTDSSKANIVSEKTKMIANGSEFYYIVNSGSEELGSRDMDADIGKKDDDSAPKEPESKDPDEVKEFIENIKYLFEDYDKLIEKLLEMIGDTSGYTGWPTTLVPPMTPGMPMTPGTTPKEKVGVVENQNLKLYEREPFDLEINKYLTGIKIILSDGTELVDLFTVQMRDVNKADPFNHSIQILPDKILAILDTQILHGTTIELQYAIKITNKSDIMCQNGKFAILNYLPSNLLYQYTIVTATNSEIPFKVINKEELYEVDSLGNIIYEKAVFDGLEQSNFIIWEIPNLYLGVNESIEIKYLCSGYTAAEQDEFKCPNTVEILEYSTERTGTINNDDWGRRMCRRDSGGNELIYCTPGNFYKLNEVGSLSFKTEIDSATAITFSVIPPTGITYENWFKLKLIKIVQKLLNLLFKV